MKKKLSAILAAVIFLTLSSCGDAGEQARLALEKAKARIESESAESESTPEPDLDLEDDMSGRDGNTTIPPPVAADGSQADSLPGWMKSGSYYFDYVSTVDVDGIEAEVTGAMAGQGGDFSFSMNTTAFIDAMQTRMLILDGVIYAIDDLKKTVTESAEIPADMMRITTDYSDITLEASGTGEINGRVLPWEEYGKNGTFIRYYFNGAEIYGIETGESGMIITMLISNAANEAPPEMFTLPLDYQGALPEAQSM